MNSRAIDECIRRRGGRPATPAAFARCGIGLVGRGAVAVVLVPVVIGCAPVALTVDDAVVMTGREARFAAHLEREPMIGAHDGLENVTVRFLVEGREVARAQTDGDGRAQAVATLSNGESSQFSAEAIVGGRSIRTAGAIYRWRTDKVIIAVDVDGTIARTDFDDLFMEPEDYSSAPIRGAAEVLRDLARDFHLFYLTARPRFVLGKTRRWMVRERFPLGPVLTAHRVKDMIAQAKYKRTTLTELRERWPNLSIGIGNSNIDSEAYGACGMLALIVDDEDEARYRPHALIFSTWASVGDFFAANRDTLAAPEGLKDVLANGRMLLKPVIRWEEADWDVRHFGR